MEKSSYPAPDPVENGSGVENAAVPAEGAAAAKPPTTFYGFLDQRLGIAPALEFLSHKTVPLHKQTFWYYWGGITLFFLLVQIVSGMLLMVYYQPGAEAYESVRQITYEVNFGWLIRSIHSWSANLMIAVLMIHMFSVFFMKTYRGPREFGWWSGLGLAGLTLVFAFSGYLLPMDQLSYFATKIGLDIPTSLPVVGPIIRNLAVGGADVGPATVQRFFALHVMVLPLVFLPILGFHLYMVQLHGTGSPPGLLKKPAAERRWMPFFPDFAMRDLAVWLVTFNVLIMIVAILPWTLGEKADPLQPAPDGIHPEWYFMVPFQLLETFGAWLPGDPGKLLTFGVLGLAGLILAAIPLWDRGERFPGRARTATAVGWFYIVAFVGITIWAYVALAYAG